MKILKLLALIVSMFFLMAISSVANNEIPEHDDGPYFYFCNGVPCQNHDIKKVIKNVTPEGIYEYYAPEELASLDFNLLEDWQLIKYSHEELLELNIMPEDCSLRSIEDNTCGFGIQREVEFVETRTFLDPPLLKTIDMNPFTDVLYLALYPASLITGYELLSYGCVVELKKYEEVIHLYESTVDNLECFFNIAEEFQNNEHNLYIYTFSVFKEINSGINTTFQNLQYVVGTND